jgi:hypothetical protein
MRRFSKADYRCSMSSEKDSRLSTLVVAVHFGCRFLPGGDCDDRKVRGEAQKLGIFSLLREKSEVWTNIRLKSDVGYQSEG